MVHFRGHIPHHLVSSAVRTDTWLLLRQHSPLLAHGRGFGRGDILTENGTLVASYAQEALLRFAS